MTKRTSAMFVIVAMMLSMTMWSAVMGLTWSVGTEVQPEQGILLEDMGAPSGFLENGGQFPDDEVVFYQGLPYGGVAFVEDGVVMSIREPVADDLFSGFMERGLDRREHLTDPLSQLDRDVAGHTVRLTFQGANDVTPVGIEPLAGVHNYFIGDDPSEWRTGVRAFGQVVFEDLWEGIDLLYSLSDEGLKYEFLVSPEADPSTIGVVVEGHKGLSVAAGRVLGHQRCRPPYIGWSDKTVKELREWLKANYPEFVYPED